MAKLQIKIDGVTVDYTDSDAFPLVFSEKGINISNVNEKSGNSSFTVTFPLTDNNKKAFKHKEVLAVTDKWRQTRDSKAEVFVNDIKLFDGAFRILSVEPNQIKGFFLVADAVWFNDLKGNLRDLSFTDIDFIGYEFSGGTGFDTLITLPRATYPATHPLICYGGLYNASETSSNQGLVKVSGVELWDLPPHLYLKEVIEKMFANINWRVSGDLITDSMTNYIISKAGKDESFWNWWVLADLLLQKDNFVLNMNGDPNIGGQVKDYDNDVHRYNTVIFDYYADGGLHTGFPPYPTVGVTYLVRFGQNIEYTTLMTYNGGNPNVIGSYTVINGPVGETVYVVGGGAFYRQMTFWAVLNESDIPNIPEIDNKKLGYVNAAYRVVSNYNQLSNTGNTYVNDNSYRVPIDGYFDFSSLNFGTITNTNSDIGIEGYAFFPQGNVINNRHVGIFVKNFEVAITKDEMLQSVFDYLIDISALNPNILGIVDITDGLYTTQANFNRQLTNALDIDLVDGDNVTFIHIGFVVGYFGAGGYRNIGTELFGTVQTNFYPTRQEVNCIKNYDTGEYVPAYKTLDIGRALPNLSQQDFIRGLMNMFNLYTIVDVQNRIINFKKGGNFYKSEGVANDITDLIDIIEISNEPKGLPKQFQLNYTNDPNDILDDSLDIGIQRNNSEIYAEKENIIKLPFALTKQTNYQIGTDVFSNPVIFAPTFYAPNAWSRSFGYLPRLFDWQGYSAPQVAVGVATYDTGKAIVPDIGCQTLYFENYLPLFGDYKTKEKITVKCKMDIELYNRLRIDVPVKIDGVTYNIESKDKFAPTKSGLVTLNLIRK